MNASKKDRVFEDLDSTSDRISETSRYIGYGLSAVALAMYSSETKISDSLLKVSHNYILIAAALGVLTVVFDYLQFLFGYFSSLSIYNTSKSDPNASWDYPSNSKLRLMRFIFFYGKQVLALVGAGFLLLSFALALN